MQAPTYFGSIWARTYSLHKGWKIIQSQQTITKKQYVAIKEINIEIIKMKLTQLVKLPIAPYQKKKLFQREHIKHLVFLRGEM